MTAENKTHVLKENTPCSLSPRNTWIRQYFTFSFFSFFSFFCGTTGHFSPFFRLHLPPLSCNRHNDYNFLFFFTKSSVVTNTPIFRSVQHSLSNLVFMLCLSRRTMLTCYSSPKFLYLETTVTEHAMHP